MEEPRDLTEAEADLAAALVDKFVSATYEEFDSRSDAQEFLPSQERLEELYHVQAAESLRSVDLDDSTVRQIEAILTTDDLGKQVHMVLSDSSVRMGRALNRAVQVEQLHRLFGKSGEDEDPPALGGPEEGLA